MNSKHYVGKRVSSLELYDEIGPITGVAMLLDDNNEIFAGDENGYVLEMECPYATQEMADAVLAKLSQGVYKGYRAPDASLDIDAELGDGVTINGVYSLLAYQRLNFGPGHLSEIAAPGENAIDHEYPYLSPEERKAQRSRDAMWSAIKKNAESITLEVSKITDELETLSTTFTQTAEGFRAEINGLNGAFTQLEATINGFTVTDASGTTRITGSSIETGSLNLTGVISWGDLDSNVQTNINNRGISSQTAQTLINQTLVSSPNIQGANYWAADGNTWMNLLSQADTTVGVGGGIEVDASGITIFSAIRDALLNVTLTAYNHEFLVVTANGTIHPVGNWDFSLLSAGLPAVFG